jgi:hypothetical protein
MKKHKKIRSVIGVELTKALQLYLESERVKEEEEKYNEK